jgi:hypothetical protein
MFDDFYTENGDDEQERDSKIDECKPILAKFFELNSEEVFYGRQLQVIFEKDFFHWITSDALHELIQEGVVSSQYVQLSEKVKIHCFWSPTNRYWKRKARRISELVLKYSDHTFLSAVGIHGEAMFDVALPRAGFLPVVTTNVNEYKGRKWTETTHTMDRIFARDGIPYGIEIKNTLDYIPGKELDVKLTMCRFLGLKPLFIMRMAPKSYIDKVRKAGGFSLIFKYQLYPHGYKDLASEISRELRLPVDCPRAIEEGYDSKISYLAYEATRQASRRQLDKVVFIGRANILHLYKGLSITGRELQLQFTACCLLCYSLYHDWSTIRPYIDTNKKMVPTWCQNTVTYHDQWSDAPLQIFTFC